MAREDVPASLLSSNGQELSFERYFSPDMVLSKGIAIGYQSAETLASRTGGPVAVVVDERQAADAFSWLDVYADDAFPVSQFARVVGLDDWIALHGRDGKQLPDTSLDVWASLILGEILAQGDFEKNLVNLPLSRVTATFSATMARCLLTHGEVVASRMCSDRLRAVEADRRFLRRPVAVDTLMPIWSLASAVFVSKSANTDARGIVDGVWSTLRNSGSIAYEPSFSDVSPLEELPELASNSIESRVIAYRHLEAAITGGGLVKMKSPSGAVRLACAAFLVGRGSSHHFLLANVSKQYPDALAWFGLLCGLHGSTGWEAHWRKAVAGIRKQLRGRFVWSEQSLADLSWLEYNWLTNARSPADSFESLPKLNPRLLLIEILPGVNCQFRFAGAESTIANHNTNQQMPETSRVDLLQAIDLLQLTSQKLIKIASATAASRVIRVQEELPLNTPQVRATTTRRKKSKGDDY